jgi:hypothetical protein
MLRLSSLVKPTKFQVSSIKFIRENWQDIIANPVEKNGFTILDFTKSQHLISKNEQFKDICELFGNIQRNPFSGPNGLVDLYGHSIKQDSKQSSHPEKERCKKANQLIPHTDGPYINGIVRDVNNSNKFKRVMPPKLVLLLCRRVSSDGGLSTMVDGKQLLIKLLDMPSHHEIIHSSHLHLCTIHNNSTLNQFSPIFNYIYRRTLSINYETEFMTSKKLRPHLIGFNEIIKQNMNGFKLDENQLLVIDNRRMLHGRTRFSEKRHMVRAWIQDELLSTDLEKIQFYENDPFVIKSSPNNISKMLEFYKSYTTIDRSNEVEEKNKDLKLNLRIRLNETENERVVKVFFDF